MNLSHTAPSLARRKERDHPQCLLRGSSDGFTYQYSLRILGSGLPHAAQNFLLVVLSVPHLVQRIALPGKPSDSPFLYHPAP
jgi:hypothetical protein